MRVGRKITREDITSEIMALKGVSDLDPMRAAITDPEVIRLNILKAGLLPAIEGATPAGAKSLLGSISQAVSGGLESITSN